MELMSADHEYELFTLFNPSAVVFRSQTKPVAVSSTETPSEQAMKRTFSGREQTEGKPLQTKEGSIAHVWLHPAPAAARGDDRRDFERHGHLAFRKF